MGSDVHVICPTRQFMSTRGVKHFLMQSRTRRKAEAEVGAGAGARGALFPIKKTHRPKTDLKQTLQPKKTDFCLILPNLFVLLQVCVKHCNFVKNF